MPAKAIEEPVNETKLRGMKEAINEVG